MRTALALVAAAATALLAWRGVALPWVLLAALIASIAGAAAIVRRLPVVVAAGELVVLVGGRHRGADRRWRGWRIVSGGRTMRLPAEEVHRVPVRGDRRALAAALDATLFRHGTRGDTAAVLRAAADRDLG